MPHLVISYAKQLENHIDIQKLCQDVWTGANEFGLFKPEAIKSRAIAIEHFVTGGRDTPFVHVDAKLFQGRTDAQKQDMNQRLFNKIDALVPDTVAISVEAINMDQPNYLKRG